jgi:hypothetical protein
MRRSLQGLSPRSNKKQASNGITITGYATIEPDQINAYYNAANATPGTASVTVTTTGGTSAATGNSIGIAGVLDGTPYRSRQSKRTTR